MDAKEMAERTTVLRAVVGSTVHGLSTGADDRDEMGVCVEDMPWVVGLQSFEQYIYRTAAVRENDANAKSQPGDLDLCIYGLRKYLRLALQGNPTILNLLFAPAGQCVTRLARGAQLQELAPLIVSRQAGRRFLGYLEAQRQRLLNERGGRDVRRPELEQKYGYDTKYAMHMLRLGYQGVELLEAGRMTLPMPEPERSYLLGVRTGQVELQEVLTRTGDLERQLKDLLDTSPLPVHPRLKAVEAWMLDVYFESWKTRASDMATVLA